MNNLVETLYWNTINNAKKVGNKTYAVVPIELLIFDSRFQRDDCINEGKVAAIAENLDENKMEAIRITRHDEECRWSVVDGIHRIMALMICGVKYVVAEICEVPQSDPERLEVEAKLFATQNDNVQKLTAQQKHKANIILKVYEDIVLDRVVAKYGIEHKPNGARGGSSKENVLTGYTTALRTIKNRGERCLDETFDIIVRAGWNRSTKGFCDRAISSIANVVMAHNYDPRVIVMLSKHLEETTPDKYFAYCIGQHQNRRPIEAIVLEMENYLASQGIFPASTWSQRV